MVESAYTSEILVSVALKVCVEEYKKDRDEGGEFTFYLIKVVGPGSNSFHLKDRFSSLSEF